MFVFPEALFSSPCFHFLLPFPPPCQLVAAGGEALWEVVVGGGVPTAESAEKQSGCREAEPVSAPIKSRWGRKKLCTSKRCVMGVYDLRSLQMRVERQRVMLS